MNPSPKNNSVKIAVSAFAFVFLGSLLYLKPYLPRAIFYNFSRIDDYHHFSNRVVKTGKPQPWEIVSSSVAGVQMPQALESRLKEINTTALVVIRDGKLVYERYEEDGDVKTISGSFSMAKSIVALLTGFAIQDKLIPSLDSEIVSFFPEMGEERKDGKVSIKNMLTMSTGSNWNESYYNPFAITAEAYYGDDLFKTAFKQRQMREPGKVFSYLSGTSQLLGMTVSRAVGQSLSTYASEKLWVPLGAETEALWSLDHEEGIEKSYCCFNATARDFARIGQLVLQKGMWNGVQLLSADYISAMTTAHHIPDEYGHDVDYYGYQWWIEPTAQGPVPYARGILGQYIIVIPQKNAVIVRLGHHKGEHAGHTYDEVQKLIQWALADFKG